MERDLSLLKKDLSVILHLNKKINYQDKNQVQDIHNAVLQKQLFQTSLGEKFITRLEYILMDAPNHKCLLCEKENELNGIICLSCIDKYQNKPPAKAPVEDTIPKDVEKKPDLEPVSEEKEPKKVKEIVADSAPSIKEVSESDKPKKQKLKKKKHGFKPNPKGFLLLAILLIAIVVYTWLCGPKALLYAFTVICIAFSVFAFIKIRHIIWIPIVSSVISIICLAFSIILIIPKNDYSDDLINYLGTLEEQVYTDYNVENFHAVNDFYTNESYVEGGKPALAIYHGEVNTIVLDRTSSPSYSIANIHVGDDYEKAKDVMAKQKLYYVPDKSIPEKQLEYMTQFKGQKVQIIILFQNNSVIRISCGFAR